MTRTPTLDTPVLQVGLASLNLHPGQLDVLQNPARFKMLRAGRRWRKSGLGVIQAFTGYDGPDRRFLGAFDGGHIGWWVPSLTARYIVADWLPIRAIAAQIPGSRVEEANHRVVMPNDGGSVMLLTGDNVDSGRGLGLDGAVLDEATLLNELLWTETVRPTLIDRRGWALFLYTPKGLNWVYDLDTSNASRPDWASFQFKSEDNPSVDPEEIASLREQMSTLTQRQELDAEYVAAGAGMFYPQWIQGYRSKLGEGDDPERTLFLGDSAEPIPLASCTKFHTVDLAWSLEEGADYTVISSWAVTPKRHLILLDVIRGHFEGPDIIPRLRQAYDRWGGHLVVERTTRQMHILQEAQRTGLPIREVRAEKDKVARALPATARMEQGRVWFPRDAPWFRDVEEELLAFPAGRHDDFVDTLSYAVAEAANTNADTGLFVL